MNQRPDLPQPDGSAPRSGSAVTPAVEDAVLVNEGAGASSAAVADAAAPARLSGAARLGLALGWGLALLALGAAGWMWRSHTQLRTHMAQDLARLEAQAGDLKQQLQRATQHSAQQSEQAAQLEQKVAAIDTQRQQTDAMLQTLAQSQQSALLAELRTALQTAQQQAQFTGQVQPLLQALTAAEQRLAAQLQQAPPPPQQSRLAALQQAVAQDLAHLRAARVMDVAQLLADLDALLLSVNTLPLQSQSVPALQTPASAPQPPKKPVVHVPQSRWLRLWQSVSESLAQLVRVRTLPSTSAALIAPEQIPYVREHLHQRLMGARMALLLRQLQAAQRDLDASSSLLEQYFDAQAPAVQATQKTLQQVQQQTREGELPVIAQTLQALAEAEAALPAVAIHTAASAADSASASAPAVAPVLAPVAATTRASAASSAPLAAPVAAAASTATAASATPTISAASR